MEGSHTVKIWTDKSLVDKHSNQYLWSRGVEINQGLMDKTGSEILCYIVCNGRRTWFWKEIWNGQIALKDSYSDLFLLCNNADTTVFECWSTQGWN